MKEPQNAQVNTCLPRPLEISECFAKSYVTNNEQKKAINIIAHSMIVGKVAEFLIQFFPQHLQEALFPNGSALIAASHDVGKICPTFQKKIYESLWNKLPSDDFECVNPELEHNWGFHAGVSEVSTRNFISKEISEIIGQHHGYSPQVATYTAEHESFGGLEWQKKREEFLTEIKKKFNSEWPRSINETTKMVLAGLTTVSDWIGSSCEDDFSDQSDEKIEKAAKEAVKNAGFLKTEFKKNLKFEEIFDFNPNSLQKELFEICTSPGVYIVEAPMGSGKTEAALYAAYRALQEGRNNGIYFALPTQLTSNKIYLRVEKFLSKILSENTISQKVFLVHSLAKLLVDNFNLAEEGKPGGSWFDASKRAILAPFAVGTIDQALMAVMNIKFGAVRTFGLSGKVIILDEVHSYDVYTGTILNSLITHLEKLQCTIIILSATLTNQRKKTLLNISDSFQTDDYPLITQKVQNQVHLRKPTDEYIKERNIKIEFKENDQDAINEVIERAINGYQVLWIENTVDEAQNIFKEISARSQGLKIECGLLHSRFLKIDREKIESHWINLFGKNSSNRKEKGRILVGTQVLEQSLDIDVDFLVTRLCPTDMLLQRMGRLWRHDHHQRPQEWTIETWILTAHFDELVKNYQKLGKSQFIYEPYVLMRTLKVWENRSNVIIPKEIRTLLEETYEKEPGIEGQEVLNNLKTKLFENQKKLQGLARLTLVKDGQTLPENFSTRYSERETVELLLIKKCEKLSNKKNKIIFIDNTEVIIPNTPTDNRQAREIAAKILMNTVTIFEKDAPKQNQNKDYNWLSRYIPMRDSDNFRIARLEEKTGEVYSFFGDESLKCYYNSILGFHRLD